MVRFHALILMAVTLILVSGMAQANSKDRRVTTAADVLVGDRFKALAGMRVGIIVNHTSRAANAHLIDLLHAAPGVTLAAIFTPEHGLRGQADAGAHVKGGVDTKTGVPIHSLYGTTRTPTRAMLKGLDVLVFDIQDIGARFYTYISTMGLAMQAAAKAGIGFKVLDRPNPLGGEYVAGFIAAKRFRSFVGQYAIPIVHGMTAGELAAMIKGEGLVSGVKSLDMEVIAMRGWRRDMLWPETGLEWLPTSPAIPKFENALVYPGTAFFEAGSINYGRGTDTPFMLIGAPWINGAALADRLNSRGHKGVRFEAVRFTPKPIPGSSRPPKFLGQSIPGIRIAITDHKAYRPLEAGVEILCETYRQARRKKRRLISRRKWLSLLAGTDRLYTMLSRADCGRAIARAWQSEIAGFKALRQKYLIY